MCGCEHGSGGYGSCGCGHHGYRGFTQGGCSCGCHHGGGHGGSCSCQGGRGHHGGSCSCGSDDSPRLHRRFFSRQERTGDLEAYLKDLEAEIQGVREALAAGGTG